MNEGAFIVGALVGVGVCAALGAAVSNDDKKGLGAFLGFLFGPLGVLIAAIAFSGSSKESDRPQQGSVKDPNDVDVTVVASEDDYNHDLPGMAKMESKSSGAEYKRLTPASLSALTTKMESKSSGAEYKPTVIDTVFTAFMIVLGFVVLLSVLGSL